MSFRGKRLGRGLWRRDWYSICSKHREYSSECHLCQKGCYVWYIPHKIDHFIYKFAYPIWHWWHNRPNSATRKRLEGWFPNLKQKI